MFPKENPLITETKAGRASSLLSLLQHARKQEKSEDVADNPASNPKD